MPDLEAWARELDAAAADLRAGRTLIADHTISNVQLKLRAALHAAIAQRIDADAQIARKQLETDELGRRVHGVLQVLPAKPPRRSRDNSQSRTPRQGRKSVFDQLHYTEDE